jgi:hypothetical protein
MPTQRQRLLLFGGGTPQFAYQVTVTAGQATTPKFTFAVNAPPAKMNWGDGSLLENVVSGVELTHTYVAAGVYTATLVATNQDRYLTQIDINTDFLFKILTPIQLFRKLTLFYAHTNATWIQNISGWVLPATLANFYIYSTSVTGDISGWVLPATLANFYIYSTSVTGDISGWVLPATLATFYIHLTSVTGDISGWVLPATLVNFLVYSISVTGDISGWVLPATLKNFYIYSTTIGNCPTLSSMVAIQSIQAQGCALPEATVDLYLSRCVAREAATTFATPALNLSGTNAAPSAAGLLDKAILVGLSWVCTTN